MRSNKTMRESVMAELQSWHTIPNKLLYMQSVCSVGIVFIGLYTLQRVSAQMHMVILIGLVVLFLIGSRFGYMLMRNRKNLYGIFICDCLYDLTNIILFFVLFKQGVMEYTGLIKILSFCSLIVVIILFVWNIVRIRQNLLYDQEYTISYVRISLNDSIIWQKIRLTAVVASMVLGGVALALEIIMNLQNGVEKLVGYVWIRTSLCMLYPSFITIFPAALRMIYGKNI